MPRKKKTLLENTPNQFVNLSTNETVNEKTIPTVCKSIRKYRERLGIEQKELGNRIGVVGNAVCNWENGRSRPDMSLVPKICDVLGITLYDLFDISDPTHRQTMREKMLLEGYRNLNEGHKYTVDNLIRSLSHIESVETMPSVKELILFEHSLAAGFSAATDFDDNGEPIYLYLSHNIELADCVFSVNGDSMEPEFHNNDLVLVQRYPRCEQIHPGEIGAFIIGNETYIKQYQEDGLHSLNSDYKTMHFDSGENVYFIGKVLGVVNQEHDFASEADIANYKSIQSDNK
ncbi:MAG: LexA family transcriptional regulator [Clostridia bacterium]|nr:LexA family transcriptional regulator [Clostridia bacterium]